MKIELLTKETIASRLAELAGLLADAVRHGASVGFVLPLADDEVGAYWRKVWADVDAGQRLLISAIDEAGRLIGSAQLALEARANGRHRAEVQKVMVLASHRGRGIGAALMARVEAEARAHGRLLLHLDTSVGEGGATRFYDRLGYAFVGGIPDFAANPDGSFAANAIYYKRLSAQAPGAPAGLSLIGDKGPGRLERPIDHLSRSAGQTHRASERGGESLSRDWWRPAAPPAVRRRARNHRRARPGRS